jgi:ABC-2 type transport system permease protein
VSRPASHGSVIAAQLGMDLRLSARRGENVLATIVIPAAVLLFFGSVPVMALDDVPGGDRIGFLLAGSIALGVIATSLVNLGIVTGYERHYGVLKRLGGTPLTRGDLAVARLAAVLVIEAVQVGLLLAIALGPLGWRPTGPMSPVLLVVAVLLGTAAFAGIGLLLAGTLRAEATLALANGLFLVFLLLGGIVLPVDRLPAPLATVAEFLPAAPLAELVRMGLGVAGADPLGPMVILAAWALATILATVRFFRWE